MNVCCKYLILASLAVSIMDAVGGEHDHDEIDRNALHNGIAPFEASMTYDLILTNSDFDRDAAKAKHKELSKQYGVDTVRSKSASEKDDIYIRIAEVLPAGTIFRVVTAYNNGDGNIDVSIETKEPLPSTKMALPSGIESIHEAGYVAHEPEVIYRKPGKSSESLPNGWTKDKGFQQISDELSSLEEDAILKVSIVFDNSDKITPWTNAPYTKIIDDLMSSRRGEFYGLSDTSADLVWWTQDITLAQAESLFNSPKVINLVPRN